MGDYFFDLGQLRSVFGNAGADDSLDRLKPNSFKLNREPSHDNEIHVKLLSFQDLRSHTQGGTAESPTYLGRLPAPLAKAIPDR